MLGKKTRPVIGNLITGPDIRGRVYDVATSPNSPLELIKIQSPRGVKSYGAVGVGLGIVAALEKSGESGIETHATKTLNLNPSNSVPVNSTSTRNRGGVLEEMERDSLEEYTYVTSHGPNQKSHTRVYYDGGENGRSGIDRRSTKSHRVCVFDISPASSSLAHPVASDFLSSCHLCQKKLHGKDIYMYRGEKAFCSTECRYRQIVTDERKEKCSSEASRSASPDHVSNSSPSPYSSSTNGHQIFPTGIFAI